MFWFFKQKDSYKPGTAAEERAEEKFTRLRKCRFSNEAGESYSTDIQRHRLVFRLLRKNVFAWCESRFFSCTDFIAEADFSFDREQAYSSAGIIFRKGSEFNYYYFLVSSKGFFRIDCVFNGKPMPLIEWTPLSSPVGNDVSVKVVALGGYFNFHVNGEKICSLHDEIIAKGDITFCCQNYDLNNTADIILKRFLVNSVGFDVESAYSEGEDISADQKFNLAKSLYERGKFETAAVWAENIIRKSEGEDIDYSVFSLYGEILLNMGMYEDALKCFDRALSMEPENAMLILEKGNLLYQQGKYLDLIEFLDINRKYCGNSPVYFDLKGHAAYFLGKYRQAFEYYIKASSFDPDNPFYIYNAGKCSEADDIEEAAYYYRKALLLFFRQDRLEDVRSLLSWFDAAEYNDFSVESIRGKLLFSENNYNESERIFSKLIETGEAESDIYYLYALILYRKGDISGSIKNLETSCSMEPEFPLYFFRLAEFQFSSSADPSGAIEKALELDSEDVWINNLAGLIYLDRKEYKSSLECFEKAWRRNSDEKILLNYAEALKKAGDFDRACEILDSSEGSSVFPLQKSDVLISAGRYQDAYELLESAYRDDPDNADIMKKLAEVCYNTDKLSRTEELLYLLESMTPDSSVYNMIGNTARIKGEFSRAEAAYLKSLDLEFNPVVVLNYIEGICEKQDFSEAYRKMEEYFNEAEIPDNISERYSRLKERILKEAELTLKCASCNREWKVPKNTVMNRPLRIVGEPSPESPAGKCPVCGKIYCVECGVKWLEGNRFTCPDCSEFLKLNDDYLRFLVSRYTENTSKSRLS